MSRLTLDIAVRMVRAWTRSYTSGIDAGARDARRAEIESDLWEHQHTRHEELAVAFEMLRRLLLGLPDDVRWRIEQRSPASRMRGRIGELEEIYRLEGDDLIVDTRRKTPSGTFSGRTVHKRI